MKTRLEVRTALQKHHLGVDVGDGDLDNIVRMQRRSILAIADRSETEQAETFVEALKPWRELLIASGEEQGFDTDDFSVAFWDLLEAGTAGTKSATVLEQFGANEEAWANVVSLVLLAAEAAP